jgi:nitroreductase
MNRHHSHSITPDQLLTQLQWRYATKAFDPARKIAPMAWAALEESLVLTPSSFGLQPWKFVVVSRAETREQLVAVSCDQRQVADASHLVVFAIKSELDETDIDSHVERIAKVRGTGRESLAVSCASAIPPCAGNGPPTRCTSPLETC